MIPQLIVNRLKNLFHVSQLSPSSISGGSINEAYTFNVGNVKYFVKFNEAGSYPKIIDHEVTGLRAIADIDVIRTPEILLFERIEKYELLVLPFIGSGRRSTGFWQTFGRQLAQLHIEAKAERYGWYHDNYIGILIQSNKWHHDFHEFWINERIDPQVRQAIDRKLLLKADLKLFQRLYNQVNSIFPSSTPSLVHGDLWSGNFIGNDVSGPVLIDPAIHYSHFETDLAFTHLFGGFDPAFYRSYEEVNTVEPEFNDRKGIYNLYPFLVHLNLFGSAYYRSVKQTISQFK